MEMAVYYYGQPACEYPSFHLLEDHYQFTCCDKGGQHSHKGHSEVIGDFDLIATVTQ